MSKQTTPYSDLPRYRKGNKRVRAFRIRSIAIGDPRGPVVSPDNLEWPSVRVAKDRMNGCGEGDFCVVYADETTECLKAADFEKSCKETG